MLLRDKLSFVQVFRLTWRLDLLILFFCTLAYLVDTYWLKRHVAIPVTLSTVMGTAIAFFIGFNNNQAYGRWWEGRKIWGQLVNDSRSWARSLLSFCDQRASDEAPHVARRMVFRHIGFLYALKASLRKTGDPYYEGYLSKQEAEDVAGNSNIPNAILNIQAADLQLLREQLSHPAIYFLPACSSGSL
jgi:putative membrane protein